MGLTVSFTDQSGAYCELFGGSYAQFYRWRRALAGAAAVPPGWDHDGMWSDDVIEGYWGVTPSEPLLVLLAHSDCHGFIHAAQFSSLIARLVELIPRLPEDPPTAHGDHFRDTTIRFVNGLTKAHNAGVPYVVFR
jgi:hypothetical protein